MDHSEIDLGQKASDQKPFLPEGLNGGSRCCPPAEEI